MSLQPEVIRSPSLYQNTGLERFKYKARLYFGTQSHDLQICYNPKPNFARIRTTASSCLLINGNKCVSFLHVLLPFDELLELSLALTFAQLHFPFLLYHHCKSSERLPRFPNILHNVSLHFFCISHWTCYFIQGGSSKPKLQQRK